MWLELSIASGLCAISALMFAVAVPSWGLSTLFKLIPAIAGIAIANVTLMKERYLFVATGSVALGLVTLAWTDVPPWVQVLPWFLGLCVLDILPWVRPMVHEYPLALRGALTVTTVCLTCYLVFFLIGVRTDDAIALLWVAWILANFTCFLLVRITKRRWPYFLWIGVQAHMAHAVLVLGFIRSLPTFYTSLPLLIFYSIVPAMILVSMSSNAQQANADDVLDDPSWMNPKATVAANNT